MDTHVVVSYAEEDGQIVARSVPRQQGAVARCEQCDTIIQGAKAEHLVGCPQTKKFGRLTALGPCCLGDPLGGCSRPGEPDCRRPGSKG